MINRKKKLRILQFSLFFLGTIIIFFFYLDNRNFKEDVKFLPLPVNKTQINNTVDSETGANIFYNIKYSGFDLSGNRYVIKSAEAVTNKSNPDDINMKGVEAIFYFKNNKNLKILSDVGIYNNNTLDMYFEKAIRASYDKSTLTAGFANYSNSKGLIIISDKVKVNDIHGNLIADKLLFDLKTQSLNISSQNKNKINANISIK
jgi:lipopolysaccharide export system protein LptA